MNSRWFNVRLTRYRYSGGTWDTADDVNRLVFKGYMQTVGGASSVKNGAVSADTTHVIYCPPNTDIIHNDEIVDPDGIAYVVVLATPGGVASLGKHSEIEVSRR